MPNPAFSYQIGFVNTLCPYSLLNVTQLAGAIEYTDYTSAEGLDTPHPTSVRNMTLDSLTGERFL